MADNATHRELMTTQEVADLLRKPVATIRRWRMAGSGSTFRDVPAYRVGRSLVFKRDDVLAWLETQRSR
jgi:excisionase family DNA binding protein